ncbi:MAG: saccharopine dehydrogenase [Planctomycetes bacterium]|nr:saccharopine dehydrogenase [Planctomycetota bacterium]
MKKAVVLGAGMVGAVIARDLIDHGGFDVTIADLRDAALGAARRRCGDGLHTVVADLADPEVVTRTVASADIVLGALASRHGYAVLRAVIEAGKDYCDISFMPEDASDLDDLARQSGVTAVVDCGVAPGMTNMLAARGAAALERAESIDLYVGGLPAERRWPFEYKAGFAPHDVIEEYTRPARLVEGGRVVVREALSEPELVEFDGVGTLEAFNTDGLRSLVRTLDVPFMREKTLRYPGHIELMRVFRATGLFSEEPVDVGGGQMVRPRDLLAAVLFPRWTFAEGEGDLTVFRATVRGVDGGRPVELGWDMLDRYDPATATTSMARTTAFPCAIVARMIADGTFREPGVHAPERLGASETLTNRVLEELERRGVVYTARCSP